MEARASDQLLAKSDGYVEQALKFLAEVLAIELE